MSRLEGEEKGGVGLGNVRSLPCSSATTNERAKVECARLRSRYH